MCFFFSDDKKEVVSSEKFGPAQTEPREVRNAEEKSESKLEGKHCPSSTEQMCIHMHIHTRIHIRTEVTICFPGSLWCVGVMLYTPRPNSLIVL